mmetsp:Transcript_24382/g.37790  ORF Transcript_24382/g.37790 Transcript_24382/m.37790 type:complete len:99 (-) Transcript_24382:2248-2544(-)
MDDLINKLKTQSLECINLMLKSKNQEIERMIHKGEHQILEDLTQLIPLIIQSLIIFSSRSDLEQILEEDKLANFIVQAMEVMALTASQEKFKPLYYQF